MKRTVFTFSGQGSQYYQMGHDLYVANPVFRRVMLDLDDHLKFLTGRSVVTALYESGRSKAEAFDELVLSHPAIFMVEVALAETLMAAGLRPDATLGASLGTYAAAVVAGSLSPEVALETVAGQAETFLATCPAGAMVAVLDDVGRYGGLEARFGCELASLNYASHFVVSCLQDTAGPLEAHLRDQGVVTARLPVPLAFHSKWIEPARPFLRAMLEGLAPALPKLPLFCCAQGGQLDRLDGEHLWQVARRPVDFRRTIAAMEAEAPSRFIDLGPSGTLATFLKYGLPPTSGSTAQGLMSPMGRDLDRLAAVAAAVA